MVLALTLRHFRRHWRLNLVLLASMVLGATLLAGLPMLANTISGDSLAQSLQDATVSECNLTVRGVAETDEPPPEIAATLGEFRRETAAVREVTIAAQPTIFHADGSEKDLLPVTMAIHLWSFDRLDERVVLLEGRWPQTTISSASTLEAVIGSEAAERSGLVVGDEVVSADDRSRVRVVGIVAPTDPDSEIWWGDRQLLPFTTWRRISFMPDVDEMNISLLLTPQTMSTHISRALYWRVILDREAITPVNAAFWRETIVGLQSRLTGRGLVLETGLTELLDVYQAQLSQARVSLLLLTFQSLLVLLYMLALFGDFLIEQSKMELSTLAGRGFGRGQLTGIFALSSGLLALVAWPAAPLLTRWIFLQWARWRGDPTPVSIPAESWWLALAGILFGWLALVVSLYLSTGRNVLDWQSQQARPERARSGQRRFAWDFFLLALGGLAYWQLTQVGSVNREGENAAQATSVGAVDPVLLLAPSLLLLAAGLIFLRLFPLLLRGVAWLSRRTRGLIWPLGLTRFARQATGPNRMTLLISLTAGLVFFATVFAHSLDTWQRTMARYTVGADLRLRQTTLQQPDWVSLPGVRAATQVYRGEATFPLNEFQRSKVDLLAVDPATFTQVASYPPGFSPFTIRDIMRVLEPDSPNVLPVVISNDAIARHLRRGDQVNYELGLEARTFEVTGIIANFPLLDKPFALTNLARLEQQIDLTSPTLSTLGAKEVWLATDPRQHQAIADRLTETGNDLLVGDAQAQLQAFQAHLVSREAKAAFRLNATILVPLSGLGFLLIQLFTARRRATEFGVLQALGLSRRQLWRSLVLEGVIIVALGLALGSGMGYGLALMMRPFLSHVLASSMGGIAIDQILIDWPIVGAAYAGLVGFYGLALLLLLTNIVRNSRTK